MHQPHNVNNKLKIIPYLAIIGIAIIGSRLFHLQIKQTNSLLEQSQKNFTRIEKIQSPRGNILDCFGKLLATNRPVTNVYWQGQGNTGLSADNLQALEKIAVILGKPFTTDTALLTTITTAEKKYKKILLACDIPFEQLSQILEQVPEHSSIKISTDFKRYYPYKTLACHILGYLGNIKAEPQGKMGLEKMFEDTLKGEQGSALRKINSAGRNLSEVPLKEALTGQTIQTTIDIDLQEIVEQIFPDNQAGTFILMDPEDGALVSLVSRPNFDPNIFLDPITPAQWQTLQNQQPFLNRAFNSMYPPGSIFKLVSISAALEHGIVKPESTLNCRGYITFGERQYGCARRHGHGVLTTGQALALSCNILFYEIGKQLSIDTLAHFARKFGLGQKTNICFNEKEGLIPTSLWKLRTKGERWWPGETLSASIGQSFTLVSPIQVACMISSIFTGYLTAPRILLQELVHQQPLDIKQSTLDFLRQSMKSVVTKGTGIRVSRVKDIEIYAKTSTAQTSALSNRELGVEHQEHAWFVAHFSYKDNKPLTIVILAENVGSSRSATNIAKNFLVEYKKLMDSRKHNQAIV